MNPPSTALYVRESGQPGAPAIVFLHGTGASGAMWEQHLPRLGATTAWRRTFPGTDAATACPRSRTDTSEQVAGLIQRRSPSQRAYLVGLSLGGSLAHTLLAGRQDLLGRVVIDGGGALPAWWIGPMKLGVAAVSPVIHRGPVVGLFARMVGVAAPGRDRFAADLQAASPGAFRRAFADGNGARISSQELGASCPTLLVAGEREATAVRASNAALAALMPNAVARFAPGRGHGWLAVEPELHCRIVAAWIGGQELPAELRIETTAWSRAKVAHVLGRPVSELEEPRHGMSLGRLGGRRLGLATRWRSVGGGRHAAAGALGPVLHRSRAHSRGDLGAQVRSRQGTV